MTISAFSALTRRRALAGAAFGAAALGLPGLARAAATPVEGSRPNFLFIMADDLGYADLSCYGRREYSTPHLDRLAAQGTRFTNGYTNSAVCSPTRFALITGRYQQRQRAGLQEPMGNSGFGLDPAHPTLPSLLGDLGYHTALIGKWHLGSLPDFGPLQSGYDEFWGNRGGGVDYYTHGSGGGADLWDGDVPIERQGYYTDLLGQEAIEFLSRRSSEPAPWLLSLHFTAPHWPWEGDDAAGQAESARLDADGGKLFHHDGGTAQAYADMVTSLDATIGRILDHLHRLGLDENTVVVFTSDNGGERFSMNWPFSGMKSELLEGGIRVPFIVRWPGLGVQARESAETVISMDILPTFLAAAGGAPDPAYPSDGRDFRQALVGEGLPARRLFWRYHSKDQRAVREGQYKYLQIAGNEFLFDVEADPLERANLASRQPERFAALRDAWITWNADMVPADDAVTSYSFKPSDLAQHYARGS